MNSYAARNNMDRLIPATGGSLRQGVPYDALRLFLKTAKQRLLNLAIEHAIVQDAVEAVVRGLSVADLGLESWHSVPNHILMVPSRAAAFSLLGFSVDPRETDARSTRVTMRLGLVGDAGALLDFVDLSSLYVPVRLEESLSGDLKWVCETTGYVAIPIIVAPGYFLEVDHTGPAGMYLNLIGLCIERVGRTIGWPKQGM